MCWRHVGVQSTAVFLRATGLAIARIEVPASMSLSIDLHGPVADVVASRSDDAVLWHHAAFCRMALPLRAPRAGWSRAAGNASIRIEPGPTGHALPSGQLLRLILLAICDAAFQSKSPVVELGESPADLAERVGLPAKANSVAEQMERILAARIVISADSGPELVMFDARGRLRVADRPWRPTVRLSSGFHASLLEKAVPLERRMVEATRDTPASFDAYAWIRQAVHGQQPGQAVTAGWNQLLDAFGTSSQDAGSFRTGFEAALRLAADADASLRLSIGDEAVRIATVPDTARTPAAPAAPNGAAPAKAEPPAAEPAPPITESPERSAPPAETPAPAAADRAAAEAMTEADKPHHAPAPPPAPRAAARTQPVVEPASPAEPIPETVSLPTFLTGLPQVIWLRRGYGPDGALIGVTPGDYFDAERLTVLSVEPMVLQVSGGLNQRDFDRISAWIMVNRDLIDDIWAGQVASLDEVRQRIRKAPAPGWR